VAAYFEPRRWIEKAECGFSGGTPIRRQERMTQLDKVSEVMQAAAFSTNWSGDPSTQHL
jgi:hypothetical protein